MPVPTQLAPEAGKRKKPVSQDPEVREGSEMEEEEMEENEEGEEEEEEMDMESMPPAMGKRRKGKCSKAAKDGETLDGSCGKCASGKCDCGPCKAKRGDAAPAQGLTAGWVREDLKCGKGAISQGEKCHKGPATRVPSATTQLGQAAKRTGLAALEVGKWWTGYNIGKAIASGTTGGKNEKAKKGKVAGVLLSTALLGPTGGLGAARRVGYLGSTDLQQHAKNEKKEKAWRRSVGYKDSIFAKDVAIDYNQLAI